MSGNKRAIKRITRDMSDIFNSDELRDHNKIFCLHDENNIYDVKALITGPKDTPYEGGFFLFSLKFPEDYPLKPPSAQLKTLSPGVRFNPNLYEEGKVCLSIIGTWSGPKWTVCMTMKTVLISIQSLMSEMPYRNEPGHDSDSDTLCHQYNDCINFHTFRVAVIGVLKNPPPAFKEFLPVMEEQFVKDFDSYSKRLKKLKDTKQGIKVTAPSPFTNMSTNGDYASLEVEMNELYEKLSPKYAEIIAEKASKKPKLEREPKSSLAKKIAAQKSSLFK